MSKNRQPIPKKLRFEVFKRDGFSCQYCGRKAPDVVLHCDHIHPVSEGGKTEILNLVTSCEGCNLGKGCRTLSDNTVVNKQVAQMSALEERRQQLEMMLQWRESIKAIDDEAAKRVAYIWYEHTDGQFIINDSVLSEIKKLIKAHGVNAVCDAMDGSLHYIKCDDTGHISSDSANLAWSKISGILRMAKLSEKKPYLRDLFYIRGILRNRLRYVDEREVMVMMELAVTLGVLIDEIKSIAREVKNWTQFRADMLVAVRSCGSISVDEVAANYGQTSEEWTSEANKTLARFRRSLPDVSIISQIGKGAE